MKYYYGADHLFTKPLLNMGNPTNDYGLGFYLTTDYHLARLWASKNENGGYVLTFDLDLTGLKCLELNHITEEDTLKWITILIKNRFSYQQRFETKDRIDFLVHHYNVNLDDVDVIIGYRADDSYFVYSYDFVNNTLSLETLSLAMQSGKLGLQTVLKSEKAFHAIKFIKSERIEPTHDYDEFRKKANQEYKLLKKNDLDTNTFIRDIIRRNK